MERRMNRIERDTLMTLEAYAKARPEFRARVLSHKKNRILALGPNVTLIFEDELTIRYQVQEMLRVEKTFEERGILDELEAYNPLIPDGTNWKATMLIEFPEVDERKSRLAAMRDVEHRVVARIDGQPDVVAIADEDMERSNAEKTSAVHFLRFELPGAARAALRTGAGLAFVIDHDAYRADVRVPDDVRRALLADLD
jgi:hypothetical protein